MNPAFASALSHALFHFVWQGSAVAVLLAAVLYGVRPRSARVRYALACLAMLAMLGCFTATLAWFWPHPHSVAIRAVAAPPPDASVFLPPFHAPSPKPPSPNWIAPAWLLGVLLFSLRSFGSWLAAARLKRSGVAAASAAWQETLVTLAARARVSRPVKLLESCKVDIPVVIGFLKPVILAPASLLTGFPAEHLEVILLHELAHIRRQDYLVNLLQKVVEDILFYHPAVWWVSSVIRAEREHCCDDAVIAAHGDAHEFAEALASLEQRRWSVAEAAAIAANGGHLMHRIQRLLNPRYTRPRLTAAPAFSAVLLIAAGAIAVSIGHAQNPPPRPAPAPQPKLDAAPAPAPQAAPQPKPQAAPVTPAPAAEQETPYKKWLNEEVFWIITPAERKEFQSLASDEERQRFIEQFWLQRDPTPGTEENEFREEYYRRLAYANESFSAAGVPGWKTDRGMVYIKFGGPDRHERFYGGTTYEQWSYQYIEGLGNHVIFGFNDDERNGTFHLVMDPGAKYAPPTLPGIGPGVTDRFTRTDGTRLGTGSMPLPKLGMCLIDAPNERVLCFCSANTGTTAATCQIPLRNPPPPPPPAK